MAAGDAEDIVSRGLRLSRRDPSRQTDFDEGLEWLNQCHAMILTDGTPWTFMQRVGQITLQPGVSAITFSALATELNTSLTIERVLGVFSADGRMSPLKGMDYRQLELSADGTLFSTRYTGSPVAFAQIGLGSGPGDTNLVLWPTPDVPLEVHVQWRPVVEDLAAGDFPLIPKAHAAPVLSHYVAARMWEQQAGGEAQNEASKHDLIHERALKRLIDAYGGASAEDIVFQEPTLNDPFDYGGRWL